MEPFSSSFITSAIAGAQGKMGDSAVKSAYDRLKEALRKKQGSQGELFHALTRYEQMPKSLPRRLILHQEIEKMSVKDDGEIQKLVKELDRLVDPVGAMNRYGPGDQGMTGSAQPETSDGLQIKGKGEIWRFEEKIKKEGRWDWEALDHAHDDYEKALAIDPGNWRVWVNQAYFFHLIGYTQTAYQCLDKAREIGEYRVALNDHYIANDEAIAENRFLSGGSVSGCRPSMPDWFRKKYPRSF